VLVLSGAGVGGGSLVWANVSYRPHDAFFTDPQWAHITDWRSELEPFYELAERMLGVTDNPTETSSDRVLRAVADHFGVGATFRRTPVAVYFGERGVESSDPYFGGAGPTRTGCLECGGCMVGCRFNAKNSLDQNYLYLAERGGARVFPEQQVVDVRPLAGGGYRVVAQRPGARLLRPRRAYSARHVVFAAGALGTSRLLLALKEQGLERLSPRTGYQFRTNSEAIVGASALDGATDYSRGVAITSSIHPEPHTHIEVVRYPPGSNSMGLLTSLLVDGGGRIPRPLRFVLTAIRHPRRFLQSLSVRNWSERTVILLVMQSLDNSLRVFRKGRRLSTEPDQGKPSPAYIPVANEAARVAAQAMGGIPGSSLNEVLLAAPLTAHILGGAAIGDSPATGVVDPYHRVYGYEGLHVVDGAAVGANLGVNPSLSITAMAERAMAFWPNKGEADPRPAIGEPYRGLAPVMPAEPLVPEGAPAALRATE
jgi:cholesterol oxidase